MKKIKLTPEQEKLITNVTAMSDEQIMKLWCKAYKTVLIAAISNGSLTANDFEVK